MHRQISVCVEMTEVMHTIPTAVLKFQDWDLLIKRESREAIEEAITNPNKANFLTSYRHLEAKIRTDETHRTMTDLMSLTCYFKSKFKVIIPTKEDWSSNTPSIEEGSLLDYTDGSKMNLGVGTGIYGIGPKLEITVSIQVTYIQSFKQ